ncbi:hypothetical protein HBH56_227930 [Parastagonospora nodorum]|nr:hypothetical protein HBH56_227930 [Parastagonospora nodorum]KAH3921712.1 hypothetical protein HBH54_234820 [Parastagonospora nodorum]KAH3990994.1 hypothetical protein HBI10_239670 [Parastagonospora nodorum]KAH4008244.1 hypothetical protein HBI13_239220 [Parastagonospora nodorum]KAH4042516.1 hypothetical protein HBH49_248120 [Parastagonospora nodorum]
MHPNRKSNLVLHLTQAQSETITNLVIELDNISISLDVIKDVMNRFVTLLKDRHLQPSPTARYEYTSSLDFDTEHVLKMPQHDEPNRCYVLQEDDFSLCYHNLTDSSTTGTTNLQVKNIRDLSAMPMCLFSMNAVILSNTIRLPYKVQNHNFGIGRH